MFDFFFHHYCSNGPLPKEPVAYCIQAMQTDWLTFQFYIIFLIITFLVPWRFCNRTHNIARFFLVLFLYLVDLVLLLVIIAEGQSLEDLRHVELPEGRGGERAAVVAHAYAIFSETVEYWPLALLYLLAGVGFWLLVPVEPSE
ncbi:hypothetical protein V8C44DRAFT_140512 [Trichoderma aethiopicum]